MKVYRYKARNRENYVINDVVEAVDKGDAVRKLKYSDLVPLEIYELKISGFAQKFNIAITSGIGKKDLVFFLSQFYNLMHAGLGIIESLRIIIEQTGNKYLKRHLVIMLQDIRNGSTMYNAMQKQSKAFPKLMIEMIKVGEVTGNIEGILYDLHIYYEKQMKTMSDIKGALTYPVILVVATIAVTVFLLIAVIPQIQSSLESTGNELPVATRLVISVSEFLQNYYLIMLVMSIIIVIAAFIFNRSDKGKVFYSNLAIKMPVFGTIIRKSNLVRISRTFSTLLKSKVNAIEALEITNNTLTNTFYKDIVVKSQVNLENGVPMSKAFEKQKIIDPVFVSMLTIGEETATLENMLRSLAEYYDSEMEIQVNTIKKLMEPLIITILVVVVGVIILAVMTPMFSMMQ